MTARIFFYVVAIWLLFFAADILNGKIENALIAPGMSEYEMQIFSVFRLLGFVIVVTYIFISLLRIRQFETTDLIFIGIFWFVLSVFFDFVYVHYFKRVPMDRLFMKYNLLEGRLKGLVLITQLIAPYLLGKWRYNIAMKRRRSASRKSSSGSSNSSSGKDRDAELPAT